MSKSKSFKFSSKWRQEWIFLLENGLFLLDYAFSVSLKLGLVSSQTTAYSTGHSVARYVTSLAPLTPLTPHSLQSAPLCYARFAHSLRSWAGSLTLLTPLWESEIQTFRLKDLIPEVITVYQMHWLFSGEEKFKWELILKILRSKKCNSFRGHDNLLHLFRSTFTDRTVKCKTIIAPKPLGKSHEIFSEYW